MICLLAPLGLIAYASITIVIGLKEDSGRRAAPEDREETSSPVRVAEEKRFKLLSGRRLGREVAETSRVIFVVDDEPVIVKTLAIILSQAGFQVHGFEHPQEATVARSAVTPDLLISDVMMPGMTGVDLAIEFRNAAPDCRILLFSGQAATTDLLEEARELGYDSTCCRNLSILPTY